MNMPSRSFLIGGLLIAATLLSGCFRYENDPGEGGVTIGEARELDEIAAELDARAQAPGVSLGNMGDDNDMTSPVTAPMQAPPTPAPVPTTSVKPTASKNQPAKGHAKAAPAKPTKTIEAPKGNAQQATSNAPKPIPPKQAASTPTEKTSAKAIKEDSSIKSGSQ